MKIKMMIRPDRRGDRIDIECEPIPTGRDFFDYWLFADHLFSSGFATPYKQIVRRLKLD